MFNCGHTVISTENSDIGYIHVLTKCLSTLAVWSGRWWMSKCASECIGGHLLLSLNNYLFSFNRGIQKSTCVRINYYSSFSTIIE